MRAFLALAVPQDLAFEFLNVGSRCRAGRAVSAENLHVTLSFLGDVTEQALRELDDALQFLDLTAPNIRFQGVDTLGGTSPLVLAAMVEDNPVLTELHKAIRRASSDIGLQLNRQRYRPHVTLRRLNKSMPEGELQALGGFLEMPGPLAFPEFTATSYGLYQSTLHEAGARYDLLADYPLAAPRGAA